MRSDCLESAEAVFGPQHTAVFTALSVRRLDRCLVPGQAQLWADVLPHRPSDFSGLFRALAGSAAFKALWADRWTRAPFLLPRLAFVASTLTLADLAEGLAVAAAAGEAIPVALGLATKSAERINSQLPPVRSGQELEEVLGFGTVFLNAASKRWSALAKACRAAGEALGFPANVNVYVTAPGRSVSTPAHADHHDVLVLQTQGEKRWRVYRPPVRRPGGVHPCHRGKHEDVITPAELGDPLLDVTLRPGECLFIPAGFPHLTSTCDKTPRVGLRERSIGEASVHLTLGISAADCGLTYGALRGQLLLELGAPPAASEEDLDDDAFWALQEPLRLGCLAPTAASVEGSGPTAVERIGGQLAQLVWQLDLAQRGLDGPVPASATLPVHVAHAAAGQDLEDEADVLEAACCLAERWVRIHGELLEIYDRGYAEVVAAAGDGVVALGLASPPGASAFHTERSGSSVGEEAATAAAAADPVTVAATSSISRYCDFLRVHVPEAELPWSPMAPLWGGHERGLHCFELVD